MAVARRKLRKQRLVKLDVGRWIHRINRVFFINGLTQDKTPPALSPLKK